MYLKLALCLFFLVAFSKATPISENILEDQVKNDYHNIINCKPPTDKDQALYRKNESSGFTWFWQIREKIIDYPNKTNNIEDKKYKITCVKVIDLRGDGYGGYPSILKGGLDMDYITVKLASQRGRGYKFSVELYGEPITEE